MKSSGIGPTALRAGDLMSRDVKSIGAFLSLVDAARQLAASGHHGAPVVDEEGRCIGVLSVTDLARTVSQKRDPPVPRARTCSFQEQSGNTNRKQVVLCTLEDGACPLQRLHKSDDGQTEIHCSQPHEVLLDWQVVEMSSLEGRLVRDAMSREVVSVTPDVPVSELARLMLDRRVHRLLVLDFAGTPVGVVSVDDLLQVLGHIDLTAEVPA